jgi:putative spermidine/putrescine transport system substrate-binding protein
MQRSNGLMGSLAALSAALSIGAAVLAAPAAPGEGRLDVVAWPGYFERGESDKSVDWVTPFEKETGCKVNAKSAGTSDEMVALMNQGGYDLVTASGDSSLRLVYGKRVRPIDLARVSNYGTVDPRLQGAPWHTVDQVHYGVPYTWGPNLLAYNTKVFKQAPTSWSVVFEPTVLPDGKPNKGRIQAYDGPIHIAIGALYLKSTKPDLGIADPYELNETQYGAVLDLMRKQHPLVHRYWHDANVQVQDFSTEGIVAADSWPFQVNTLVGNKQPIASTIPKEGVTGWADTTMLATNAAHPNCAYRWLEYSLKPEVQAEVAAWFGSNPAVPKACKVGAMLPNGCQLNGFDSFARISFWRTPTANCGQGAGKCVPYSRWSADYVAVKGGR